MSHFPQEKNNHQPARVCRRDSFLISDLAESQSWKKPTQQGFHIAQLQSVCFSADLGTFLWGPSNSPHPHPPHFNQGRTIPCPLSSRFQQGGGGFLLGESPLLSSQVLTVTITGRSASWEGGDALIRATLILTILTTINHSSHPCPTRTDFSTWSRPQHVHTHG